MRRRFWQKIILNYLKIVIKNDIIYLRAVSQKKKRRNHTLLFKNILVGSYIYYSLVNSSSSNCILMLFIRTFNNCIINYRDIVNMRFQYFIDSLLIYYFFYQECRYLVKNYRITTTRFGNVV